MENKISTSTILSIIATGIMSFSGIVIETSMNITFPTLMKEFSIDTSSVQWMTTIYLLVVSIIIPLSAILNRDFKTKSLFMTANILFIIGVGIDLFANSFQVLLLGRVIQGLGTGIALPLMFNIILVQIPKPKIGMMMGFGNLIIAIAPAIGPTFGGLIVSSFGWRYIFAILMPILVVSLVIGTLSIKQVTNIEKIGVDMPSLGLIIVTFSGLVYGFSSMGDGSIMSIKVIIPILIGMIALVFLYLRSNNIDQPILDLSVLKNYKFAGHVFAFFIIQFIILGLSFILPNYVQLVNDQPASVAGLIILPGTAIAALITPFAGKLLDDFGAYKPFVAGLTFGLIGLMLFIIFGVHLQNWMILVFFIFCMLCVGLVFGNIMTNGLKQLNGPKVADGNAIYTTVQQISGAISTSIISAIISISQHNSDYNEEMGTAIGSEHGFIVLFIMLIIAAIVIIRVVDKHK